MQVSEIMTHRITTIAPDTSLRTAARLMRENDIGALPVMRDGEIVGIVTDRDLCCRGLAEALDPDTVDIASVMTFNIECCFEDQNIQEIARIMERKHIRRLAVLKRDNTLAGMISVDDLAVFYHHLAGEVLAANFPPH